MKKLTSLAIFGIAVCAMAGTKYISFTSLSSAPEVFCGLGTVREIHHLESAKWNISVSDVEGLSTHKPTKHEGRADAEQSQPMPKVVTLALTYVFGCVNEVPTQEWIGRRVLFVAHADTHEVQSVMFDLSPTGESFYVFNEAEQALTDTIVRATQVLRVTNDLVRIEKMALIIESLDEDEFVQKIFVQNMVETVIKARNKNIDVAVRTRLLGWRENAKFNITFQLFVDSMLKLCSPEQYEWDTARIAFLEKISATNNLDERSSYEAKRKLEDLKQFKQRFEAEQRAQKTATNSVPRTVAPASFEPKTN